MPSKSKSRSSSLDPIYVGKIHSLGKWNTGETWTEGTLEFAGTLGYVNEAVSYETHKGPPFKEGGPFSLRRYSLNRSQSSIDHTGRFNYGPRWLEETTNTKLWGDFATIGLPNTLSAADLEYKSAQVNFPSQALGAYGYEALNRINPLDLSKVNLVQSLIELYREGMPSIPGVQVKKTRERMRAAGGEYLNAQFGWGPIYADIRNIYETYKKLEKMLAQIIRDNGKSVRRRVTLDKSKVVTKLAEYPVSRIYPGVGYVGLPGSYNTNPMTAVQTETTRVWCVGRGSYYIPNVESVEFRKKFIENLYGTKPNPAVLYELMPWSWLIDWFSNLGDIIQYYFGPQLSEFVLDYCYLMRHSKKEIVYSSGPTKFGMYPNSDTKDLRSFPGFQAREVYETKERIAATPFGFGLKLSDLSSKQLAILSALGLSKQKFL